MFDTFFTQVNKRQNYNTRSASNMFYTLLKVGTNYGIFNIRFKGPKVWNSISENLKTLWLLYFKLQGSSKKGSCQRLLVTCIPISSCVVSQITCKLISLLLNSVTFPCLNVFFFHSLIYNLLLVAIALVCSSYINVLYSYITVNLTILDFLNSVEIAFFPLLSLSFF